MSIVQNDFTPNRACYFRDQLCRWDGGTCSVPLSLSLVISHIEYGFGSEMKIAVRNIAVCFSPLNHMKVVMNTWNTFNTLNILNILNTALDGRCR